VLPVHLYGRVADVPALRAVFATQGAVVVEEACQAVGARLQGRPAGSLGSAAVFSFGREKAVASIGEGGAVVTNDDALAERLRRYCNQGASGGDYNAVGLNLRIDPLQASVIRAEIADADAILRHRRSVADAYTSAFAGLGIVRNPVVAAGDEHGWYLYVIEVPQRDTFRRHMARRGVETKVHYERPVHLWSAHANLASPGELPIAERLCSSVVSLPLNEYLTDHQIRHVQTAVQEAVAVSQSHE
jgi:dTDP-4-amino-4,6-dideoxygalactose transaminase